MNLFSLLFFSRFICLFFLKHFHIPKCYQQLHTRIRKTLSAQHWNKHFIVYVCKYQKQVHGRKYTCTRIRIWSLLFWGGLIFFFLYCLYLQACKILLPTPGIEPAPPAVGKQSHLGKSGCFVILIKSIQRLRTLWILKQDF